jgi:hypothetical protein
MKTASHLLIRATGVALSILATTPVSAAPQPKQREYRALMAKSVTMTVSGAAGETQGKGAAMAREGWSLFDRARWEQAMDRFLGALEADPTDASAAEGLTMAVYRSGDRISAAQLGEEFAPAMPWIRTQVAETLLVDLKNELERGELAPSLALVESLPHGAGAYDRVRALLEGAVAESAEIGKGTVAQRGE